VVAARFSVARLYRQPVPQSNDPRGHRRAHGLIDCTDRGTALQTLSAAVNVEPDALLRAVCAFDTSRVYGEDLVIVMPREVLASLGVDLGAVRLAEAHYFHATRVVDPSDFHRQGIRALDAMLDDIWTTLHGLVSDACSGAEWAAFRESVEHGAGDHDGDLYRLKTRHAMCYGPHGELVREMFFDPSTTGWHDWLDCPEIVEDIARCYASVSGGGLLARFRAATTACLVKFRSTHVEPPRVIADACWYLRGEGTTRGGFHGDGVGVPPDDVLPPSSSRRRRGGCEVRCLRPPGGRSLLGRAKRRTPARGQPARPTLRKGAARG
jgi:hypothetical protein